MYTHSNLTIPHTPQQSPLNANDPRNLRGIIIAAILATDMSLTNNN